MKKAKLRKAKYFKVRLWQLRNGDVFWCCGCKSVVVNNECRNHNNTLKIVWCKDFGDPRGEEIPGYHNRVVEVTKKTYLQIQNETAQINKENGNEID